MDDNIINTVITLHNPFGTPSQQAMFVGVLGLTFLTFRLAKLLMPYGKPLWHFIGGWVCAWWLLLACVACYIHPDNFCVWEHV